VRRGQTGSNNAAPAPLVRLQRVFNNRHIENLFRDFASIKFFLSRTTSAKYWPALKHRRWGQRAAGPLKRLPELEAERPWVA